MLVMQKNNKTSLPQWKFAILIVQFVFISIASICTGYVLGFSIINNMGILPILSYSAVLLSYFSIIFYAIVGYKKSDVHFIAAIYVFAVAIVLNIILPFRNTYQLITLILLFGLYVSFAHRLKQYVVVNYMFIVMLVFAIAFSLYSTITAKLDNMGSIQNTSFSIFAMYISIWTPVVMTVTFALAYNLRQRKSEEK